MPELVRRAGVELRQLKSHALSKAGAVGWPARTSVPVEVAAIPIKKSVLDVVSFRSLERVRERLFGAPDKPDVKIPGKEKASRLGEPGRLHLHQCVAQFRAQLLPETIAVLREHFGPRCMLAAVEALHGALQAYLPRVLQRQQELQAARAHLTAISEPLRALAASASRKVPELAELGKAFDQDVASSKEVVLQPAAPRGREARPSTPAPSQPPPRRA